MEPDRDSRQAWTVEPYRPGDETAILDLFVKEFGVQRSVAHWRWKFLQNPYGGPFISLAWHREHRFLVGNQVLMPFPLNVGGTRHLGGHSLDLVVHHDFRRQGVFEQTARHAIETLRQEGGVALVAFPNASSYPGFVRTLAWKRILEPERWVLRLGLRRKLERRLRVGVIPGIADSAYRAVAMSRLERSVARSRAATPEMRVAHHPRLPDGVDALWQREALVADVSLWKDREYLSWRYEQNPDHRFTFHALERSGVLVGLAVSVVRSGIVLLCELLVPERNVALGYRLVCEAAMHCAARDVDEIQFFGRDGGFFGDVLRDFARQPAPENVFVGRAIDDPSLTDRMADAARWTVSYGDGDFV